MLAKVEEAPLHRDEKGLVPHGDGWFIVNIAASHGAHTERFGDGCMFEGRIGTFPELGFNVRLLQPGQPAAMYHREGAQEAFLVLSGECVAVVEDVERPMRKGDFLHSPPGAAHVLVGAGQGPCSVLMVGARKQPLEIEFPASETAARYGASVEEDTNDRSVAYGCVPTGARGDRTPLVAKGHRGGNSVAGLPLRAEAVGQTHGYGQAERRPLTGEYCIARVRA